MVGGDAACCGSGGAKGCGVSALRVDSQRSLRVLI